MLTAKITSKGQITIPAKLRKSLNTQVVELEERDGEIVIRPVRSVAGALKKYAAKGKGKTFEEIREKSWEEATREKRLAR
ncbi:MAG: AbrB/MazE/SpoVT family DNA-binding domain-containing protein [Geobacter sp.]|nr:AbrB/MazE/SpoVT family DNA-binding domain-containing protein [Geobacter sp.]